MTLQSTTTRQPIWWRALLAGATLGLVAAALSMSLGPGPKMHGSAELAWERWLRDGIDAFARVALWTTPVAVGVLAAERWAQRRFLMRAAPGTRRLPSFGFLAWGALFTCFAAFRLADVAGTWRLGLAAFVLAWWVVGILLARGVRGALVPALTLTAVPWYFAAVRAAQRVAFIMREGGMEHADGRGSPGIFLAAWVVELSFTLVPLTAIAARLGWALWHERSRSDDVTLESLPRPSR